MYASFWSKVLEMCFLNLIMHCVKYLEVIVDHFNLVHITDPVALFQFLFSLSDILGDLPRAVIAIIANFTGSHIQKI